MIRINKYLSEAGVCSRRAADRMLAEARITVNGSVAQMGQQIDELRDQVCVDGQPVTWKQDKPALVLMLNKPRGVVCSTVSTHGETNVVDYVHYPERVFPVGRLDKDSEGLLLLTNDGELMDKVLRARNHHEKEYLVTVNKPINEGVLRKMEQGVPILDTITRPCKCTSVNRYTFRIVITQGLNRQIRRMCEYFDYEVTDLERIRFLNLRLGDLERGAYRALTPEEIDALLKEVSDD